MAGGRAQNTKYKCMRAVEIYDVPVGDITDQNCILFMWATYPMLPEALHTIKAWGFRYKTNGFTWIKLNKKKQTPFFGMGRWTRRNSEICLLATVGKPKPIRHDIFELVHSPIRGHSEKPEIIKTKIVELCGDLPRIELFARKETEGWDVWGDEVTNSIELKGFRG